MLIPMSGCITVLEADSLKKSLEMLLADKRLNE
jgi:hypothetical protein